MIDCGDLLDPLDGDVDLDGTVEGSVAIYTCFEGFVPNGPVIRTCGSDGMWSGVAPLCEGELERDSSRLPLIPLKCRRDRLWRPS